MDRILRGSLMGRQGEQRQQLRHLVSAHGAGSFGSEDRGVEDPSAAAGISTYRPPVISSRSPAHKTADEYEAWHGCDTALLSLSRPYQRKQHSLIRGATPPPASDPFGSRLPQ